MAGKRELGKSRNVNVKQWRGCGLEKTNEVLRVRENRC